MLYLSVFLGGGLGSVLRFYLSGLSFTSLDHLKLPTMFVNILGSAILGVLVSLLADNKISQTHFVLFAVGFCGGLTTFSTFIYDFYSVAKQYSISYASLYALASLAFGFAAFFSLYTLTMKWINA